MHNECAREVKKFKEIRMDTLTENSTQNLTDNAKTAGVSAEDIVAAIKPLIDEYFLGTCSCKGDVLLYTSPQGKRFVVSVKAL